MRFLYSGIVNIALLGLSTLNLSAIAATPPTAVTQATTIDRIAIYDSSLTTIRGNGVEFKLSLFCHSQNSKIVRDYHKCYPESDCERFYC